MTGLQPFLKKSLRLAFLLAGLAGLFAGYWGLRFTADVEPTGIEAPSIFDAREASRKMRLFETARQNSRKGFIRLTEVELNSFVTAQYFTDDKGKPTMPSTAKTHLLECRADLSRSNLTWYCWLERPVWRDFSVRLTWRRTFDLQYLRNRWVFVPETMRLGDVDIPPDHWTKVTGWVGDVDPPFAKHLSWVADLPAIEIRPNELSQNPEIRLYTYPETNAVQRAHQ